MKRIALLMCLSLLCFLLPSVAEETCVTGKVTEIEKYGHAVLDITVDDFNRSGFELGDIVTVKAGNFEGDMPFFNGYYVDRGEYMVRAYPGQNNIAVCINYGNFAETAGIAVGDPVTLTLKEKAGALTLQEVSNLVYTSNRVDYASDEIFANFRAVIPGKLYRSASPIDNTYNRAGTADRLIQKAGVKTVMNLASTEEDIAECMAAEDFASPYYKELFESGSVIPLGLPISFDSDEFAEGIVKGFSFLADHDTPFIVHCTEGKDRAGFAVMVLEMLAGFTADDIVTDYMRSYVNYYGIEAGSEKYNMIVEKNIKEMMLTVAGLEKGATLDGVDWKAAAEQYLAAHGMSNQAIASLEMKLM